MRISDWSSDVCSSDIYDWPFLQIRPFKDLEAGEKYYDFPTVDLEQIENVVCYYNGLPHQVMRGIRSEDYAAYDSAAGERVDPVSRWDVQFTGTTDQIEVWPIPASNGMRLQLRSEEHTSELQSLMRIPYAVCCLKKKINYQTPATN